MQVDEETVTVGQMIDYLRRRLLMEEKPLRLKRLLQPVQSRRALVCTFLALLELVRLQAILLRQDSVFGEILIKKHDNFESVMRDAASVRDDWN
jgi:segregation and condensation protein A